MCCLKKHLEVSKFSKMIMLIIFLTSISTTNASVSVHKKEIVAKKGEDVELICSSSKSQALGCSFKSPAEEDYNMLRGAAYEEGRIQQKEINPNDCAMKITNIRQSDHGIWSCNVTAKDKNGEYDIGNGEINLIVAIAPVEVSMKINNKFVTGLYSKYYNLLQLVMKRYTVCKKLSNYNKIHVCTLLYLIQEGDGISVLGGNFL